MTVLSLEVSESTKLGVPLAPPFHPPTIVIHVYSLAILVGGFNPFANMATLRSPGLKVKLLVGHM